MENQKQLLRSLFGSLLPQSLSSFPFALRRKKLKRDNSAAGNSGFSDLFFHALLRWNANGCRGHHHRSSCFPFLFILILLFLVALLLFLSPQIASTAQIRGRLVNAKNHVVGGGMNLKREEGYDLWRSKRSEFYFGCSNASRKFLTSDAKTHPDRYLIISTSGGLNQQRTGIIDSVVAAYILNATLVVPILDQNSYWKDSSDFTDIFDVDRFISFLSEDVKIIKQLPSAGSEGTPTVPLHFRVPRKCNPYCYITRILPLFHKNHVVQLTKFDYRLSNQLNSNLQKLRCRVNYHALQFTDPILDMGKMLVQRMRMKSKHFIALHLRFEPDMLAFSGCDYGGGEEEKNDLGTLRKRWKSLHKSNPAKQRRQGRCPLTPEEVGVMLKALGYDSDIHIYVASGEVYGGEDTLAPLKTLFPNFHSKDTIATKDELSSFAAYSARMAAIDFIVCDQSDVFVSNNNGNMVKILAGRRRYFGHKRTIRPNAKKLHKMLLNRNNMTWEDFTSSVKTAQVGFMGEPNEMKLGRGEFHENPTSCICQNQSESGYASSNESDFIGDYQLGEEEVDLIEDMQNKDELGVLKIHHASKIFPSNVVLKAKQTKYEDLLAD